MSEGETVVTPCRRDPRFPDVCLEHDRNFFECAQQFRTLAIDLDKTLTSLENLISNELKPAVAKCAQERDLYRGLNNALRAKVKEQDKQLGLDVEQLNEDSRVMQVATNELGRLDAENAKLKKLLRVTIAQLLTPQIQAEIDRVILEATTPDTASLLDSATASEPLPALDAPDVARLSEELEKQDDEPASDFDPELN